METFTELKELIENPHFQSEKRETLSGLNDEMIDTPIADLIKGFNKLPYCFTLQSCCGHFMLEHQMDTHNLEPLPADAINEKVKYRIAYIAFCIENSDEGRGLFTALKEITRIDPENIQFGCADWFWERQINSYVLQVEPDRFKHKDTATFYFNEAVYIEKIRNRFFNRLYELSETR